MERLAAWAVHAFTASGVVLGLLMVHFSYQGEVRTVLWLFLARALVVAHGGFLGAEGDDHDTVLYARLPRPPATAPEHTGPVDDEGGDR